jgi:Domain of unknown function (DUF5667)
MIGRTRRQAKQLDAALEGRASSVPDDLLPLLAMADEVRASALRIQPDHALARQRIERALRPHGRVAHLPRPEPRWGMRIAAVSLASTAAIVPATIVSSSSIPGDPLYPLKRGMEQVRVIAATSPEAEAATRTDIAYARLAELDALLQAGDLEHLPQVLVDLNLAVGEAEAAVAMARQGGADTTQVAALESQLANVNDAQTDHLNAAIVKLPPAQAEQLQEILENIPTEPTAPAKGGGERDPDSADPTVTTANPTPTTAGGVQSDPPPTAPPPTAPPTTEAPPPPTTTAEPATTSTQAQAPQQASTPSAGA